MTIAPSAQRQVEIDDPSLLFPTLRNCSKEYALSVLTNPAYSVDAKVVAVNTVSRLYTDPQEALHFLILGLETSESELKRTACHWISLITCHGPFVDELPAAFRGRLLDLVRKVPGRYGIIVRTDLNDGRLVLECRDRMRTQTLDFFAVFPLAILRCPESLVVLAEIFSRKYPRNIKGIAAAGLAMAGNRTPEAWLKQHEFSSESELSLECLIGLCVLDESYLPFLIERRERCSVERTYKRFRLTPPDQLLLRQSQPGGR